MSNDVKTLSNANVCKKLDKYVTNTWLLTIITCKRRGAPVKLCKPAPKVDKNDPIKITHWFGQAILATTNFPPIDEPNLKINNL